MYLFTSRAPRSIFISSIVALFLVLMLLVMVLTGCSVPASSAPDPDASAASAEEAPKSEEPVQENSLIKPFGEVVSYQDGVSISVAMVGAFTPTQNAAGVVSGEQPTIFKVVLTNNSDEAVEPTAFPSANSGGKAASSISDVAHPEYGELGFAPTTSLLPGQTVEWSVAFSISNPEDVTLEISPSFMYDDAIFTTQK